MLSGNGHHPRLSCSCGSQITVKFTNRLKITRNLLSFRGGLCEPLKREPCFQSLCFSKITGSWIQPHIYHTDTTASSISSLNAKPESEQAYFPNWPAIPSRLQHVLCTFTVPKRNEQLICESINKMSNFTFKESRLDWIMSKSFLAYLN